MIRLFDEDTKENRSKDIPINHHVKTCLDGLPRALKHDFVITYRGIPMDGLNSLKRRFSKLCDKAGIVHGRKNQGGITFHDIRRTVKTNMLRAGVEKSYRDLILGHKLKGMDAHYITATDRDLTRAMDIYTDWLDERQKNANIDQSVDHME